MYWLITYAEERYQDSFHYRLNYILHIGSIDKWIIESRAGYITKWLLNAQLLDEKEYQVLKKHTSIK